MALFINDQQIQTELEKKGSTDPHYIQNILEKAKELKGLDDHEILTLLNIDNHNEALINSLFDCASWVKNEIYGKRLVLFAPLYISNLCNNECLYCAFRHENKGLRRKALNQQEIAEETKVVLSQGHKRVLMVAGEEYLKRGLDYVLESIQTIYSTKTEHGSIRRINVNIAPLSIEEFKRLHTMQIGTYQIFQETYHYETYKKLHLKGPKSDYDFRLMAIDRAFAGGFDDVGIGILFGLYDWRYEILALLSHIRHLEKNFGIGPHTISLPRMEPAYNSPLSYQPPYPVNDQDFLKIIAVLRLAVPYTGLILSTRESAEIRRQSFELGISQISAGSRTNPGGYQESLGEQEIDASQFSLGDTRPLSTVIEDITDHGYIPSFCTGCYRLGRVGHDFMDLAKPGLIKEFCLPNALFTFAEYLNDFAGPKLISKGFALIDQLVEQDVPAPLKAKVKGQLMAIAQGERDLHF